MKDFLESSSAIGNRTELCARLRRDGYLFLRGLLTVEDVRQAAEDLLDELDRRRWVRHGDREGRLNRLFRWAGPSGAEFIRVYAALQSTESVHRLVSSPAVLAVAESVLGRAVIHPQRIIRTTLPVRAGGPDDPSIHRDYLNWRIPDMITVWIPLLPCPTDRGSLAVLVGSQLERTASHPHNFHEEADWVTGDFEPGDVIVFHCYTVHGVLPNKSKLLRLSIDSRWQSIDQPVPEWVLTPDGGDTWERYTRTWTNDQWIRLPPDVEILPDRPGQVDPPMTVLPQSRFLAGVRPS